MTDVHSKEIRSYNMSRIKGKNTKPEILVRKYLFSKGFRFRLNVSSLSGKPDVVLKKYRTIIFINGCFWHGHDGCKYFILPKTRSQWWKDKIQRTQIRDGLNKDILRKSGWNIITIWECQLRKDKREDTLMALENTLLKIFLDIYRNNKINQNVI